MNYRTDKLMIDGHTDTHTYTHTHTHAGNDNTRRPKLASGNKMTDTKVCTHHASIAQSLFAKEISVVWWPWINRIIAAIFLPGLDTTKVCISHASTAQSLFAKKQGKSEGFESCDRPIVRKRPIWVKIGYVLSRVTLKFDGWPWKTLGHLSFAVSSLVQHFMAIGEFKLELQSRNAQFGSNSMIFRGVWPWNLTDDLEKQ